MTFEPNLDPETFDLFVKNHPTKSHFMQSAAWGTFNQKQRGMTPHRIGLRTDDGILCAASLLLERRPPLFPSYFYAPRGFVLDFFDEELLNAFTIAVRKYCKERGAMFLALDPDIELWEIDAHGCYVTGGFDNHFLVQRLQSLGYRHKGFNREFEGRQPRFSFRINLMREQSEIDSGIVGNVLKNVRKSDNYAVDVRKGSSADVADLYRLITLTSERDAFIGYDLHYYQNFFDILSENDMSILYLGWVYPAATVTKLRDKKADLLKKRATLKKAGPLEESRITEDRLNREIELFEKYTEKYPDGVCVSAHLVVRYGDKAWAVHAGSDNQMQETFINNRIYYQKICDAKAEGARLLDQFGTTGNPDTSHLKTLHAFKRQFGGRYVEFIGEFNMVIKPFWYFLYEKVLPFYRNLRISLRLFFRSKTVK